MRRLALASLLVVAPAAAQTSSPDVTSIAGPLSLRGALESSSSHGCSQSFASTSRHADVRLDVDARGAVTLEIEQRTRETFGPSPYRYAQDRAETTHTVEHTRVALRGHARRTATTLEITLTSAERASVRYQGWGSVPLPPSTSAPVHAVLRCWMTRTDVLPGHRLDGETPSPRRVLECAFDDVPSPLDAFEAGPLLLGRGAGYVVRTEAPMFSHAPTRSIRLAE